MVRSSLTIPRALIEGLPDPSIKCFQLFIRELIIQQSQHTASDSAVHNVPSSNAKPFTEIF